MEKIKHLLGLELNKSELINTIQCTAYLLGKSTRMSNEEMDFYSKLSSILVGKLLEVKQTDCYVMSKNGIDEVIKIGKDNEQLLSNFNYLHHLKDHPYHISIKDWSVMVLKMDEDSIAGFVFMQALSMSSNQKSLMIIPFSLDNEFRLWIPFEREEIKSQISQVPHILNYIFSLDPTLIEVQGGVKKKTGMISGYHNQTKRAINVVTEKWNQETIHITPFEVQGHWRMQACGPNFSERKRIWITDHVKQGYKSKAKSQAIK